MRHVTPQQAEKALNIRAWRLVRTSGSHHVWKSEDGARTVVIPFHRGVIAPGTQRAIMKAAGLTDEDL